jgi:multicomponent Na+:H+ antiporter subunit C
MMELFLARYIYLLVLVLLAIGLYGVLAKSNLVKKVIGLTIFSTAIYLFFIEGSLQLDGTAPVIDDRGSDPALYVDPLPHLLILTAIVVGVGVVGVALSLLVRIYRSHGSLDETVVAARLARGDAPVVAGSDPQRAPEQDGSTAAGSSGEAAPAIEVELDTGDEPSGPSR